MSSNNKLKNTIIPKRDKFYELSIHNDELLDVDNKPKSFSMIGDIAYLCVECFQPLIFRGTIIHSFNPQYSNPPLDIKMDWKLKITCPHCHTENKIGIKNKPIDPNLIFALSALNRKGYETLSSRGINNNNNLVFIQFNTNINKIFYSYPLPKEWDYITSDNLHTVLIERGKNTKPSELIKSLETWVYKLPFTTISQFKNVVDESELFKL